MAPPAAAALARTALTKAARRALLRAALNRFGSGKDRNGRGCLLVLVVAAATLLLSSPLALVGCMAAISGNSGGQVDPATAEIAGIPPRAAIAYQTHGDRCPGLDWTLLAAVGAVESNHGQIGPTSINEESGEAIPWIFGPELSGTAGTASLPIDTWAGWWGLTGPWMQAVGPMQFLPPTFTAYAIDATGSGETNPHQIDDAVATAANYLCATSGEEIDGIDEIAQIYNPGSATYADELRASQQEILDAIPQANTGTDGTSTAVACPIAGPVNFTDTWGAPRSGGRTHQGVDMFAATGTPVVAPEAGQVEHYNNSLGGLSYRLYGDSGTYYYGTHLSSYENTGAGHVAAGTVIGYVGDSGNARGTPPHLHWEIHPNGRGTGAINPTPTAHTLCR